MYFSIIVNALDYDNNKIYKRYISWGESPADAIETCMNIIPGTWKDINIQVENRAFVIDDLLVAEVLRVIEKR